MELYKEILINILAKKEIAVTFADMTANTETIVASESYKALQKIKAVIEDNSLSDPECFHKIEEIVCVFEQLGSGGGNRHDFG